MARQFVVAIAVLAVGVLSTPAASAAPHRLPDVIVGHAEALHPQGVAWDPTRHAFLVGSIRHGTVSVVKTDGSVRTLISHPWMVSTTGVHVDLPRGRILVGYADVGLGTRTSPDTRLRVSGVGIFDLFTGRPLHVVDLDLVAGTHIISDLTVDRQGTAYATDIVSDTIYRIDLHGRATVLVRDPRFAAPAGGFVGIAGIVWHPNGFLLVANTGTGALFRVPTNVPRVDAVALDRPVLGADGMALRRDGTLVVVTNSLAEPGANAVSFLRGDRAWSTGRTLFEQPWPDPDPTTVAVTPRGDYVVSGHLRELATGQPVDTFTLRRT